MSKQTVTHAHPSGSFWARNRKSGGYLLRKTVRRKGYQLIRFLLLFGLCFMIIQPLLDKLSVSFMAERDLYDSTVISIPRHLTTANYSLAASKILLNYGTTFLNTLIVSLAVSVLQIAACTLVGYGFARFEFPFKKFWFAAVIITVIIPPQTISSSLYLHFNFFDIFGIFKATTGSSLNLRGSPIPYALMSATCMGLKNGLYIYMIRQFFTGIPKSLEEAAYVDGCSIFKTFWRVILPDAVPILVSCFLFSFVWQWTDTFYSKLFLGNIKLLSLEASTVADRLNSYVSIQLGLSGGAFFRSDKDYAVRATGTVDSGSGSVFKHLHRLYIRCVQVVYIRHGHPIHDEQWLRVVYRTDTSDTDRGGGTRRSGTGSDGYTGSQALQCGRNIGHCLASDFLLAHGRDSPRDITFLHRTVANHYHLIQLLCVLLQGDA